MFLKRGEQLTKIMGRNKEKRAKKRKNNKHKFLKKEQKYYLFDCITITRMWGSPSWNSKTSSASIPSLLSLKIKFWPMPSISSTLPPPINNKPTLISKQIRSWPFKNTLTSSTFKDSTSGSSLSPSKTQQPIQSQKKNSTKNLKNTVSTFRSIETNLLSSLRMIFHLRRSAAN